MTATRTDATTAAIGHDDYSLTRVPETARYSWPIVAVQRFGQLSTISQFLIGATLGFGLSFWHAVLALTLGSVLLELVTIFVGIAGVKQGLSTSLLTRWTGFGRKGSALIGLVIATSLIGWFGVQNGVFASSLSAAVGGLPEWAWALVGGLIVTFVCIIGFRGMAWVASITVPAFLLLAIVTVGRELSQHSLGELLAVEPAGEPMSLATATTIVAGGFIVGAIMTPDMTRFNRTVGDVVKQTVVGVTLGQYVIGVSGILLALALRTSDIAAIVVGTSGLLGSIILVAATIKVNDWNLYSGSLGLVNTIDVLTGKKINRVWVTLAVGIIGSILSAAGILNYFTDFLNFLGVLVPPIAGIIIAEYFVVRTWRTDLDEANARGEVPAHAPEWVLAGLVAWAAGWAAGYFITAGIPALTSLVVAFVVYGAAAKLGLVRRAAA